MCVLGLINDMSKSHNNHLTDLSMMFYIMICNIRKIVLTSFSMLIFTVSQLVLGVYIIIMISRYLKFLESNILSKKKFRLQSFERP